MNVRVDSEFEEAPAAQFARVGRVVDAETAKCNQVVTVRAFLQSYCISATKDFLCRPYKTASDFK